MQANPYQLLSPDFINAGNEALKSGAITPDEAMRNISPIMKLFGVGGNYLTNPKQIALTPAQERLKAKRAMEKAPGFVGPPEPATPDDEILNEQSKTPGVFEKSGIQKIDPGSGEGIKYRFDTTNTEDNKDKQGSSQTATSATAMDPVEFSKAVGNIESLPDIQEQRRGISHLEDMLNMSGMGGGDPVSGPLMGLLKSEFGRDTSAYKAGAGPTPTDVSASLLGGSEKLQTARNNLSQRIGDLLGKQRSGSLVDKVYQETQDNKLSKIFESLGLNANDPKSGKGDNTHIANYHRWNQLALQTMKKDDDQVQSLNKLATEIQSGNPIDAARISIIRATIDAGGRPNIAEVRTETNKGIVDRAENAWSFLTTGDMSEKNRGLLVQSIQAIADYQQEVRAANVQRLDEMGKHYELTDQERGATLPPTYLNRYPVTEGKPANKVQTKTYDGTGPLPANATPTQKKLRQDVLTRKKAAAEAAAGEQ